MCPNYLAVVPLLGFHLRVHELVGRLHGICVRLGIARNHVVELESKGEQPAVDIWVGEKQKHPRGVSQWTAGVADPMKRPAVGLQLGRGCGVGLWEGQLVRALWELVSRH